MSGPCPREAARHLSTAWGPNVPSPHSAVILGSGLHQIATDALAAGAQAVPCVEIPGMPVTRVAGHAGQFVCGGSRLPGVVLQQGRSHYYEGWSINEITFSVRVLAALGVKQLIVTNAAGGIADGMQPGDLMVITDHLCFVDLNQHPTADSGDSAPPGLPMLRQGRRVWSRRMQNAACGTPTSLRVHQGSYAMMPGPNYETPAEVRMLKHLGADAVGMSTVPEAVTGSRLGMDVLGISCITNAAAGLSAGPLNHDEVGDTAASVESEFVDWLQRVLLAVADIDRSRIRTTQTEKSGEIGAQPVDD